MASDRRSGRGKAYFLVLTASLFKIIFYLCRVVKRSRGTEFPVIFRLKAMELKNFFKRQLRTVIEWKEQDTAILFHRMETTTDEIKNASKLIVAPGQGCLVVYDGKVMATLTESGIYEMKTDNHPFITTLLNLAQQMESDDGLAGNAVVFTTALSSLTIFGWILLAKTLGIF